MKNARRKLEILMSAAKLCKTPINSSGEPAAVLGKARPNMLVLSMPTKLWGYDWKELYTNITKITSLQRWWIHWIKKVLCTKFIPMPQTLKIPKAKAAVEKYGTWQLTKVRNKLEVIAEARTEGRKVHFASLMDLCHLKNSGLEPQYQKYNGRVVLRGDIVKNGSGSYAVCTEQGSSASQMTAAKFMDIISRLAGCAGQAADAVSAYTQVKMEDAPTL